ncbi:hypothetical protein K501DRAFT_272717 [Backusella circina FSU 941]|nr:hypothetical protein K501DRAFT_272717 [Backusella circina FSU 941]
MRIPTRSFYGDIYTQWDTLNAKVRPFIKHFSCKHKAWRTKQLEFFQSKRNRFLRSKPSNAMKMMLLSTIERQISILQEEQIDLDTHRAGHRWQTKGEKDAGYLKRIIQSRQGDNKNVTMILR